MKMQYGRMVRSGALPSEEEWLQQGMLLAGEAMRTWDPEKGAYSTYIVATVKLGLKGFFTKERRGGLTARRCVRLQVLSLEQARDDVPDSSGELLDDGFADEGTYGAGLTYAGVIGCHGVPAAHYPELLVPEGMGEPVDEVARMEQRERIVAALGHLPAAEREALVAAQTESQAAYAERKNVALRTVHGRLARAKKKMAAFLDGGV